MFRFRPQDKVIYQSAHTAVTVSINQYQSRVCLWLTDFMVEDRSVTSNNEIEIASTGVGNRDPFYPVKNGIYKPFKVAAPIPGNVGNRYLFADVPDLVCTQSIQGKKCEVDDLPLHITTGISTAVNLAKVCEDLIKNLEIEAGNMATADKANVDRFDDVMQSLSMLINTDLKL